MKYFYIIISVIIVILLGVLVFIELKKSNSASQAPITAQETKILSEQVQQSLNIARQKGSEAMVKSLLSMMRAEAELIYDKDGDYSNICKSSLVNTDNASLKSEVEKILTTAKVSDQKTAGLSCFSSAKSYVVSLASNSSAFTGEFKFCIDNTGYADIGIANQKTISCVQL